MYVFGYGGAGTHTGLASRSSGANSTGGDGGKLLTNSRMQEYDGGLYGNLLAVTNNNSKLCLSSCIMMVLVLANTGLL